MPRNATPYKYVKVGKKKALEGLVVRGICAWDQVKLLRKNGGGILFKIIENRILALFYAKYGPETETRNKRPWLARLTKSQLYLHQIRR